MKNWKLRKKLYFCFGTMFLLMLTVLIASLFGMRAMNQQNAIFQTKTVPNTNYVWEMRREMISTQRYMLLALEADHLQDVNAALEMATENSANMGAVFNKYLTNYRVDKNKVEKIIDSDQPMTEMRKEITDLLRQNTKESKEKAMEIFKNQYKPLQDEIADVLKDIGDDQIALAENQSRLSNKIYQGAFLGLIIIFVLSILVSGIMVHKLVQLITVPLAEIENATKELSQGNLSVTITYESKDEFGTTCDSMRSSFMKLKEIIDEISTEMAALERGDFTVISGIQFPGEFDKISISISGFLLKMNKLLHEIDRSVEQINSSAFQVSDGAQELAQGAAEQASSVEELSASLYEVSNQINTSAKNSKQANDLSVQAGNVVNNALEEMKQMLESMEEISVTSNEIGKVIKVIDDIAFQTNILALNAAVEAARAGRAGKGFAVVADEVRNLASKSSEAAKQTTQLIENSITAVQKGSAIAQSTNEAFYSVTENVGEVIDLVTGISDASQAQANAISQISLGVDQISSVIQTNSATSEESAAASEELSGQANILKSLISQFKTKNMF